ncbi:MAG: DUF885 family protein [Planctomycetota bacterium]|jgi:uncharacterized protein (DUF885 family)
MTEIAAFVADFHRHFTRDPNACVMLGVDRHLDELPDPALSAFEDRVREARALVERLDGIDRAPLTFDDRLDLRLARLMLEDEIHRETYAFNGRTQRQQLPTAGIDVGDGIFLLFVNDPRPAGERLGDICSRLERVPEYVERLLGRLDAPVARWVDNDVEETSGLPELFATIRSWADEVGWPGRDRLGAAADRAVAALGDYAKRLRALPTTTQLHVGDAVARRIVELRGIELSLEQLHAMAREFLERTGREIEALRSRLAAKYGLPDGTTAADLHRFLKERYAVVRGGGGAEAVLARYEQERERIMRFVTARDLFPIPDDQDMKLVRTPGFMVPSIPAGAMMAPPPFRAGVKRSLVYLTLTDERLAEHTELDIPGMMIHEGIPGHHLQLAIAAGHPSVIRRHVEANDYHEGWTTMLEDYMLDAGYMDELTDEARFIGKHDISRLGARVAIDLFFMTGERSYLDVGVDCDLGADDPFAAAGGLLQRVTGFTPDRTQAELNWYSKERGYPLSYLTGNTLAWRLKADVAAAAARRDPPLQGVELDREFHRIYLEAGNMPLSSLRAVFAHAGMLDE